MYILRDFLFNFLFDFNPCAPWGANPTTGLGVLSLDGYHPIVMRSRLGIFFLNPFVFRGTYEAVL